LAVTESGSAFRTRSEASLSAGAPSDVESDGSYAVAGFAAGSARGERVRPRRLACCSWPTKLLLRLARRFCAIVIPAAAKDKIRDPLKRTYNRRRRVLFPDVDGIRDGVVRDQLG
jgi:hypothetical protein